MTLALPRIGLPLFARELTELANRSRTYVLRVIYALLLFLFAYLRFYDILSTQVGDRFAVLGQGRPMFETLVLLQFAGIYLFMPAVGCSAITQEKERNTLGLLFMTRLGPTTILLEKLLSRLVPMFVFLLLAMPLLAFTYSLGGVSELVLYSSIWVLSLTAIQVASLTLMCSAYCRTTLAAFVASYSISFVSLFFCGCCGLAFNDNMGLSVSSIGDLIVRTFLLGVSTMVFLSLARSYLTSRAFVVPSAVLTPTLRRFDRFRVTVNSSTGGMMIVRHVQSLPGERPVEWRETTRSSLGATDSLIRIGALIEIPLFLLLPIALGLNRDAGHGFLLFIESVIWSMAILLLVVTTTGLISRERDRQTLDVLLTTPLSGREILLQKLSIVRRMIKMFWLPFGTILVFFVWVWGRHGFSPPDGLHLTTTVLSLLVTLLSVLIYLPLFVWVSFWISLHVKSQGRAILLSLTLIVGWLLLPVLIFSSAPEMFRHNTEPLALLFSPLSIIILAESHIATLTVVILNFLAYGALLFGIRQLCLSRADFYLGWLGGRPDRTPVAAETP